LVYHEFILALGADVTVLVFEHSHGAGAHNSAGDEDHAADILAANGGYVGSKVLLRRDEWSTSTNKVTVAIS
jgi:hypothetical protein